MFPHILCTVGYISLPSYSVVLNCIVLDPGGRETGDLPAEKLFGRQLSEPGRFAYAGLCGVSLGQLFQEPEQK